MKFPVLHVAVLYAVPSLRQGGRLGVVSKRLRVYEASKGSNNPGLVITRFSSAGNTKEGKNESLNRAL